MISWHPRFASPFESPWCVAQKLAWLNASDVPDALSSIARRRVWPGPTSAIRNFNDLGWWDALLGSNAPVEEGKELFTAGSAVFGSEVVRQFLSVATCLFADQLRLCIPCIRSGYHSVVHQLAGLARCPIHDTPLHDSCLQCHHPLGPYVVGRHKGFRCAHCDAAFLREDDLPLPSKRSAAAKREALDHLVAWIERTLPQLQLPWRREVMFGRWKSGTMQAVSLSAAMLPLLAQIEPCPLKTSYLVDPVPQLAIRVVPSQPMSASGDALSVYEQAARSVSNADKWLRANVVGEHLDCYTHGAHCVWGDREYLSFHPEFCRHGYAFALWCGRAYSWLKWVKEIADARQKQLIIDMRTLRWRLISSYHFALNGIELLCEMDAQDNTSLFNAAWRSGCLLRDFDDWTMLHDDQAHTLRLEPCNVAFIARPQLPEPFCDHGSMVAANWEKRHRISEAAEARRSSLHA